MSKTTKPKLSVVIPAYNEALLIAVCLESLSKQKTKTPYEVIVVDNNSTDDTADIAKKFGVKVITEKRPGVCWARQAGLEIARGEIVVSTDADSYFDPDWLNRIELSFQQNSKVVASAGPVHYIHGPIWANAWTALLFWLVDVWRKLFGQPFYVSACNLAYRKSVFSGYNTMLTQGGDELFVLSQLKKMGKVTFESSRVVYTSSRRQMRGLLYNIFVTFLFYYLLDYWLSKLTHHSVFGNWPVFRNELEPRTVRIIQAAAITAFVFAFLIFTNTGRTMVAKARHGLQSRVHLNLPGIDI